MNKSDKAKWIKGMKGKARKCDGKGGCGKMDGKGGCNKKQ